MHLETSQNLSYTESSLPLQKGKRCRVEKKNIEAPRHVDSDELSLASEPLYRCFCTNLLETVVAAVSVDNNQLWETEPGSLSATCHLPLVV